MATDHLRRLLAAAVLVVLATACTADTAPDAASDDRATPDGEAATDTDAGTADTDANTGGEQRFPDVLAAELTPAGDAWRLSATLSSPYDTPERYADAFRAVAGNGTVLGVRELAHDHANEQPFTRSLTGLQIPDDVARITVEGRDLVHGWGGDTVEVEVPPRPAASSSASPPAAWVAARG